MGTATVQNPFVMCATGVYGVLPAVITRYTNVATRPFDAKQQKLVPTDKACVKNRTAFLQPKSIHQVFKITFTTWHILLIFVMLLAS